MLLIRALVHVPRGRFSATLSRILQALKPGGHALLTMKQGEGTSTAGDGRVFVLWGDEELRGVFTGMGLGVVEAFTNVSFLGTVKTWLRYAEHTKGDVDHGGNTCRQ